MNYLVYKYIFPNKKIYIGITSRTLEERWKNGYRHSTRVFNAIKKYGKKNIARIILFEGLTKEEAEQKEMELIAKYKSNQKRYGYNIENGGKCADRLNEEIKEKISKKTKGIPKKEETKKKMSLAQKQRYENLSEEEKEKIKIRLKSMCINRTPWNKGKQGLQKHTEEWKTQASLRMKKRMEEKKIPIICVETGETFESQGEASRIKNISQGNINSCLKGRRNVAGGYHWKYKDETVS